MRHSFTIRQTLSDLSSNEAIRIAEAVAFSAIYAREQLANAKLKGESNLDDLIAESEAWFALDRRLNGGCNTD